MGLNLYALATRTSQRRSLRSGRLPSTTEQLPSEGGPLGFKVWSNSASISGTKASRVYVRLLLGEESLGFVGSGALGF